MSEILVQQLNTLFSVYAGNYINTGNKVADNVFMSIFNMIFAAVLSFVIFMTAKGGWMVCMRRCLRTSPTRFNPDSFEVPKEFRFTVPFSEETEVMLFCKWIVNANSDKMKKGGLVLAFGLANSLDYARDACDSDNDQQTTENWNNVAGLIHSMTKALETPVPVWIGKDGVPVFAVKSVHNISSDITENMDIDSYRVFSLCSNSRDAIVEVSKAILSTDPELKSRVVDSKKLKVFQIEIMPGHRVDSVRNKEIGQVNPNKTFDTLFFEDKETLVSMLNRFKTRTLYPAFVPMENKLGILLHGPPGTGKSGVIQAIANYTKRHVINIDLTNIKTRSALDTIMNVDRKTHMFVFEEIDTMGELVADRKTAAPKASESVEKRMERLEEMALTMASNKPGNRPEKKQDVLTLGYLLQKIDGLISNEDTIFVATSNHPERLDPAMLRPGRFGFQLELSYCSRNMLTDIIGMMCQLSEEKKRSFMGRIPELACDVWSPVEIIQQCLIEGLSVDRMVKFLKNNRAPAR